MFKETCFEWSDFPDALEVMEAMIQRLPSISLISAWKLH